MASSLNELDLNDDSGTESPSSPSVNSADSPLDSSNESPFGSRPTPGHPGSSPLSTSGMSASSHPLGPTAAARSRPLQSSVSRQGVLPQELQERMKAFQLGRSGAPPRNPPASATGPTPAVASGNTSGAETVKTPLTGPGGVPAGFQIPGRPVAQPSNSSPVVPSTTKMSLGQRRGPVGGLPAGSSGTPPGRKRPGLKLADMNPGPPGGGQDGDKKGEQRGGSQLDQFSEYLDAQTGTLKFGSKVRLTAQGVEFEGGSSYDISLDEVETLDELGKGNYGTVFKVKHSKPRIRLPGRGLAGNKTKTLEPSPANSASPTTSTFAQRNADGTTGVVMAMKEIRLELEDSKFTTIIRELEILHKCISPFIVDFYGAFFQEGAVYICMEFMDGGSIDKLYGDGVPESVLRKVTLATTMGLKFLKEGHNIIHRDVKPTNILVNSAGLVKLCDFGVSGNLVASIAKTNIGCQSYMAPERISGVGGTQTGASSLGTYNVQSDIWSLGLTIIECALGRYPYPPETYDNIFSQLSAIVDGDPPDLPEAEYSDAAHDFVHGCLMKIPNLRPTYPLLLQHAWLAPLMKPATISEEDEEAAEAGAAMPTGGDSGVQNVLDPDAGSYADSEIADWVKQALEKKASGKMKKAAQPALHAAPLNAVNSPPA